MQLPRVDELAAALRKNSVIEGYYESGAFNLQFYDDQPFLCLAVHHGNNMREEVSSHCALSPDERLFEEDPYTGDLIAGLQNRLTVHDSRYEYDLNRTPEHAIYEEAWGEKVWHKPLSDQIKAKSLAKHEEFYQVLHILVDHLVQKYGGCVVYDIHSYNGSRKGGPQAPTFNIGTHSIDMRRYRRNIDFLERSLCEIDIPSENVRIGRDEVFEGRGYVAAYLRKHFKNVLCIPLEIKKVFCKEEQGIPFPVVIDSLKVQLAQVISRHAAFFARTRLKRSQARGHHMLGGGHDALVRKIDTALYKLARKVETLLYVNPINLAQEQKRFIARKGSYEPDFHYRQLAIDPYLFREALYRLPVENIADPMLQQLYKDAIDGLATKIDLLTVIGTREFLYNSLRYYGEPHLNDLKNAQFLLHAPPVVDAGGGFETDLLDTSEIVRQIQAAVDHYNIDAPVKVSGSIIAGAMVDNSNFRVLVKKGGRLSSTKVKALVHHEVGVHLLSTSNAREQPLKVLRLGFPGTTMTQEGMAVYAEHLGGALTLDRLKTLGHRVMAVKSLLDNHSFSQTYSMLVEEYHAVPSSAFITTARVYRGGGFTKDFLYLRGLAQARNYHLSGGDWLPFFAGKIPFSKESEVSLLIERGIVRKPTSIANCFVSPQEVNPVLDYLVSGLVFNNGRSAAA
ncbi:flavohemoglobin expression-modulating QEGLA motif protein [Kordiimonas sp. SCSIO 12603]|uniref:flavohemoglobin expression-modulating QEGLA motif protein n=1 Tax=Kordiimonas sp. SCSIO 12603 TaxID=2829596 RepID=UPI002102E29B|nr:flavohemoglobin expression-modulating QEGLA motif protein [Kordiimonas sp. SCSIO 12603]UTW58755.1 flavohemoglobin expression-modulating QEGLA motif protein [Kordiimonas sp. SCSIO 12603]